MNHARVDSGDSFYFSTKLCRSRVYARCANGTAAAMIAGADEFNRDANDDGEYIYMSRTSAA